MGESTVNNRAYLRAMRNAALNNHSFGEVNAQRAKARGVYFAEEAFTLSGHHLKFEDRQILARDWNRQVNNGPKPTIRGFAKDHGLAPATWHREYERGKVGAAVPDRRDGRRREYNEYDPCKAQDAVSEGNGNKGAAMRVTNRQAALFAEFVLRQKLSPYDAVCRIRKAMPGAYVPCVRTWYNHIAHGDLAVKYGQTPYRPDRDRPKHPRPHPARSVPGRLGIADRPREAEERLEPGHYEIDTIVSCIGGRGGLLVLIDRMTRRYFIALIGRISQRAVNRALARMVKDGVLGEVKSVTADNGSEFLDPGAIRRILGCSVYYTRAYASWEKGSVENANRMVRRWYPKGTDFSKCSRAEVAALQRTINSICRRLLGGRSADEYAASLNAA